MYPTSTKACNLDRLVRSSSLEKFHYAQFALPCRSRFFSLRSPLSNQAETLSSTIVHNGPESINYPHGRWLTSALPTISWRRPIDHPTEVSQIDHTTPLKSDHSIIRQSLQKSHSSLTWQHRPTPENAESNTKLRYRDSLFPHISAVLQPPPVKD